MNLVAGPPCDDPRFAITPAGTIERSDDCGLVAPIPDSAGYFLQCNGSAQTRVDIPALGSLLARLLAAERDTLGIASELAARYEEIDLLYTISEILGKTIGLEEAAEIIVHEVSSVVGARRASIFVHDPEEQALRPVAGWGIDVGEFGTIFLTDADSIAARAFREGRPIAGRADEIDHTARPPRRQRYRGAAFLSVPIVYPDSDGNPRPVGVINLTDRLGADSFSAGHRKLVEAIAHQIGAAIENARLVVLDRQRQRVRREMELAHDLQLRLLPSTEFLRTRADVAARCRPGELVGGDFYQFVPLPRNRIGVMLGDVSTHGFPAALIMALVLSAAGIHAAAADSPEAALDRLLASVRSELATTEMYLSLFYAVIDPEKRSLRYANAGHPHAFLLKANGERIRLSAITPPLGLGEDEEMTGVEVALGPDPVLVLLFSDGITDACSESGVPFGAEGVLDIAQSLFDGTTQDIVDRVFAAVSGYSLPAADDQALLVLRT